MSAEIALSTEVDRQGIFTPHEIVTDPQLAVIPSFTPPEADPSVESLYARIEQRVGVARALFAMIDGETQQKEIAEFLKEAGLSVSQNSSLKAVCKMVGDLNEASILQSGQPLIVKEELHGAYSANPYAAGTFMAMRERLLPVVLGGTPEAFMTPTHAKRYEQLAVGSSERTRHFFTIADRANDLLAIPMSKRHAGIETATLKEKPALSARLPRTLVAALYENIATIVENQPESLGTELSVATQAMQQNRHLAGANSIRQLGEWTQRVFHRALYTYKTARSGGQYISGINLEGFRAIAARMEEKDRLDDGLRIEASDRDDFWLASGMVNDFLSFRSHAAPAVGNWNLRTALCVFSALQTTGRLPDEAMPRAALLRTNLVDYLSFYGLIIPDRRTTRDVLAGGRKKIVINDLSAAACRGLGPNVFYEEDPSAEDMAQRICSGCKVQQVCEAEAVTNHDNFGYWGKSPEQRRRESRRRKRKPQAAA